MQRSPCIGRTFFNLLNPRPKVKPKLHPGALLGCERIKEGPAEIMASADGIYISEIFRYRNGDP